MRKQTIMIIAIAAAVLIVYDIYALAWGGGGSTISEVIRDWGRALPFVAVFSGVLMGHFFLNWNNPWKHYSRYIVLAVVFIASAIITQLLSLPSWVPFLIGLIIGTCLWTLPPGKK